MRLDISRAVVCAGVEGGAAAKRNGAGEADTGIAEDAFAYAVAYAGAIAAEQTEARREAAAHRAPQGGAPAAAPHGETEAAADRNQPAVAGRVRCRRRRPAD